MDFTEKARIRIEHWITHNDRHQEEYEIFADQLEEAGKKDIAEDIRELVGLTARCTDCLRNALRSIS